MIEPSLLMPDPLLFVGFDPGPVSIEACGHDVNFKWVFGQTNISISLEEPHDLSFEDLSELVEEAKQLVRDPCASDFEERSSELFRKVEGFKDANES